MLHWNDWAFTFQKFKTISIMLFNLGHYIFYAADLRLLFEHRLYLFFGPSFSNQTQGECVFIIDYKILKISERSERLGLRKTEKSKNTVVSRSLLISQSLQMLKNKLYQ